MCVCVLGYKHSLSSCGPRARNVPSTTLAVHVHRSHLDHMVPHNETSSFAKCIQIYYSTNLSVYLTLSHPSLGKILAFVG